MAGGQPADVRMALVTALERVARAARRRLGRRWPDAEMILTERPAIELRRQGWTVQTAARTGAPLATLLDVVNRTRGDLLIVGARGARGLRRVLLGSVAAGALNRCPVPVLVVR